MPNKFLSAIYLARLHIPASYLLPFLISSLGAILASKNFADLEILPLFFIGSITARGAGCIINDIFDRDFDRQVARTKNRPLANASVTLNFALAQLFVFTLISLAILFILPIFTTYASIVAAGMIIAYPLMKRITYFPQVFLGLTYSFASIIGYVSVSNNISLEAVILYLAICFWTIGFDIIYGFMDIDDDKKISIKSMSIWLENKHYKVWLTVLYTLFIFLFLLSYYLVVVKLPLIFYLGVFCSFIILMWQVRTLNIRNSTNCLLRFKSNIYIGLILYVTVFYTKFCI